jgi:hypothetical protein
MITENRDLAKQLLEKPIAKIKGQQSEWKTIGVRVRSIELPLLNIQLDRINYDTLGDLVKDLIAGKITRITEDQQIDIMKTNLQTSHEWWGLNDNVKSMANTLAKQGNYAVLGIDLFKGKLTL